MSFVGGGADCSANGNAIAQFNKHTQEDRSLQRQSAGQGPALQGPGFKQDNLMNARERQNMEQFMNGSGGASSFQFQPMRHELNMMQAGPAVNHQQPQQQWSGEFQTHSPSPVSHQSTGKVGSPINSQWASEFQQKPMDQAMHSPQSQYTTMPSMRMGGYRPMMGMSMMGGGLHHQQVQPAGAAQQAQEPQVDWDNHFKEIEELTNTAKEAEAEAVERAESPEFVIDDKYQATFQEVWDGLNSEAVENDFINQQYEDFKNTQREPLPADLSQWEKDFARYASTRAHFGDYQFENKEHNQFLDLPKETDLYEIGLQLMENGAKLSEAALAFEAAIQQDEGHINAWLKLGEVQTQNEKEIAGISALERCLELHPENSEALMTLAISYINEGYDNAAFATLERWMSTKYPQVADRAREENPAITDEDRFSLNKRVTELFIKAAQLSPNQANMDADVQMGLGVLFYANEDFDKTIDCFKAALTIRPDDAVLWNRLGASLANSNRSEEAVDAYFKALSLKPTFVRARYNLGVSCINIGCYKEAAEHLLSGLAMHQVEGAQDNYSPTNHNQSTALTETLKRAFIAMDRRDLVELVKPGMDLNQFKGEFNF
ncbi:peroxisomal targeting signal receptor [Suhomyces tanzawaensis NRRL Y-17324]|uniref:Peroxisomal targeting signal receptor n=1 Tax=Suhomyces tanzawaensis NRRL Y-17324 TaxID=984487 RepID=A0A1E4SDV3_9ASCO|nr:peroxisomal targeting signal receptor [Suhomyces tanzawaensis NRRL Y-17324]ODV77701.1 peroxisomal targeting signal receptor [Suhomyces tanzawaensis NRRL Y-17324]